MYAKVRQTMVYFSTNQQIPRMPTEIAYCVSAGKSRWPERNEMPFKIVRNDITKMKTDAIVNTANPNPCYGGGTDTAIYQAAGAERLLAERLKIGKIRVGQSAITPAFALNAKYIIHTVGPAWQGGRHGEARKIKLCYRNSLKLAKKHGCESIAFPLISTGAYGFPKDRALEIALSEFGRFLAREDMLIYLVVFDSESFTLSGRLFADIDSYIDERYAARKTVDEYSTDLHPAQSFPEDQPLPPDKETEQSNRALTPTAQEAARSSRALTPTPKGTTQSAPAAYRCTPPGNMPAAAAPPQMALHDWGEDSHPQTRFRRKHAERNLEDIMAHLGETFQQRLLRLIDERGMTDVEVYKKANLDRKLFSKIRCNENYRPKKMTAVALAIALELNLDETKDLLARAELALSPSSRFDLIIEYFIEREVYDIYAINLALFQHEQPILGE